MSKLIDAVTISFILIACTAHAWAQDDKDDLDYKALYLVLDKVRSIHIDHLVCQSLPLADFLVLLQEKAKVQDPDHKGVSLFLDLTKASGKPLTVDMDLDDLSVGQAMNIASTQAGLNYVIKNDGIHLTDAPPIPIPPLIDPSPELHKIIDKVNKDAYDKCEILCRNSHIIYEPQFIPQGLKEGFASQFVMRDGIKGNGPVLDFLRGLKIVGRLDGDDLDCYFLVIFFNKDGTTDEIDLEGSQGSWKGRKLEVSSEAQKALKQIIADLSPRLDE